MKAQRRLTYSSLIIALTLSAVMGCAKRVLQPIPFSGAYGQCSGGSRYGQFTLVLTSAPNHPEVYQITLTPTAVSSPGQTVGIYLSDVSFQSPRVLVPQTSVTLRQILYQGPLSLDDLSFYSLVVIGPVFDGTTLPSNQNATGNEVLCQLPVTGTQAPTY